MKSKMAAMLVPLMITASVPVSVSAASPQEDITGLYVKNGHVKVEWATEMAPADIITETGFESGDEIPNVTNGTINPSGNQSIEDDGTGNSVFQLLDTVTGRTGNNITPPDVNSTESVARYQAKSLPENIVLSLNYKVKALSGDNNSVNMVARTGWLQEGFPADDKNGNRITYGQIVDWNNPPNDILLQTVEGPATNLDNGKTFTLVTSRDKNYNYGILRYVWDSSQQKLILSGTNIPWNDGTLMGPAPTIIKEVFQVGDEILAHRNHSYTFPTRSPKSGEDWTVMSANVSIPNMAEYDSMAKGLALRSFWTTNGIVQMDDVRLGYATEAELFRNGQSVYKGYLSDFEDNAATDKAKPLAPINVQTSPSGKSINVSWDAAEDIGTQYEYMLRTYPKNAPSGETDVQSVEVKSGIKGYQVVVDTNPTFTPTNSVTTATNSYSFTRPAGKFFIHIASIDDKGNVSSATSTEISDTSNPIATSYQNITDATNQDVVITVVGDDADTWVKSIELPDKQKVLDSTTTYNVTENGDYTFILEDYNGNKSSITHTVSNIDKVVPTVTFTPGSSQWIKSPGNVSITPSEESTMEYSIDKELTWNPVPAGGVIELEQEGEIEVVARGEDLAGNKFKTTSPKYNIQKDPSAPATQGKAIGQDKAAISWTPIEGYSYTITNTTTGTSKNVNWPEDSVEFNDLQGGLQYQFSVTAKNQVGEATSSVGVLTTPAAPKNLIATPIEGDPTSVKLTWDASVGADEYNVQSNKTTTSTSMVVDGLQPGQSINLSVASANASGIGGTSSITYLALPGQPGDFKHVSIKAHEIVLSWEPVLSANSYSLYKDNVESASVTDVVYNSTGLQGSVNYKYNVSAVNATGEGQLSAPLDVLTLPEAVQNIVVTNISDKEAMINWDALSGVAGYDVLFDGQVLNTTVPSYSLDNLQSGTQYVVSVFGKNASGTGDGASINLLTLPGKVNNVTLDKIGTHEAWVNANSVVGADYYVVTVNDKSITTSAFPVQLTQLASNKQYKVTVAAVNTSGKGLPSDEVSLQTIPGPVTGLKAESITKNSMDIIWDEDPLADGYNLQIDGKDYPTTSNKYPATNMEPGKSYKVLVTKVNKAGASDPVESTFYTLTNNPVLKSTKPKMFTADLEWTEVEGAKEYAVLSHEGAVLYKGKSVSSVVAGLEDGAINNLSLVAYNEEGAPSGPTKVEILTTVGILNKASFSNNSKDSISVKIPETKKIVDKYSILRDGKLVKSIKNEEGAEWKDTKLVPGKEYQYSIIPINKSGEGLEAKYAVTTLGEVTTPSIPVRTPDPVYETDVETVIPRDTPDITDIDLAPEYTSPFVDIDDSFAKKEITYLERMGVVKGTSTNYFEPNKSITRIEFASLITRALGIDPDDVGSVTFLDAEKNSWYYAELVAAFDSGVVDGFSSQKFGPHVKINREQATKMLVNAIELEAVGVPVFSDKDTISWWAEDSVYAASSNGLVKGYPDGTFRPLQNMTRAEAVMLIYRLLS